MCGYAHGAEVRRRRARSPARACVSSMLRVLRRWPVRGGPRPGPSAWRDAGRDALMARWEGDARIPHRWSAISPRDGIEQILPSPQREGRRFATGMNEAGKEGDRKEMK